MENNNNKGNGFLIGFILGMILGVAIVFLLGTKKGRRLLKIITQEGKDGISNIIEKVEGETKSAELREFFEEESSFAEAAQGQGESFDQKEPSGNQVLTEELEDQKPQEVVSRRFVVKEIVTQKPKPRRFFRGIPGRHLN